MLLETFRNPHGCECSEIGAQHEGGFVSSETPKPTRSTSSLDAAPVCPNCHQWLQPDNHHIRLRPKPRPSLRVQRILRRQAHSKRLSLRQKNLLHRFQKASSALVRRHSAATCPADTHAPSLCFNYHSACTVTLAPWAQVCKYISLKCLFPCCSPLLLFK